jgi:hypothetical protein
VSAFIIEMPRGDARTGAREAGVSSPNCPGGAARAAGDLLGSELKPGELLSENALNLLEFYALLRQACREAGGQRAFARTHGMSEQYLCDVLNARKDPGDRILAALGLVKVVRYAHRRSDAGPRRA